MHPAQSDKAVSIDEPETQVRRDVVSVRSCDMGLRHRTAIRVSMHMYDDGLCA